MNVSFVENQRNPRRLLYIAYWGLLEPLGQSLILPTVRKIAGNGVSITLITFEKSGNTKYPTDVESLRAELQGKGINWCPLRYHKSPTIPATLYDVMHGVIVALGQWRATRPDIIHGRTFIGGVIGVILQFLTGKPFIYHNEGFWPDQQVEGGVWGKKSLIYRVCKRIENYLYEQADGLILLSCRSQAVVESLPNVRKKRTPIVIAPSCVDLQRFEPTSAGKDEGVMRLIYVGSLEWRYPVEPLGWFLQAMRLVEPMTVLDIYSQSDHQVIKDRLSATGVPESVWNVSVVPATEIPVCLSRASAGLHFLPAGIGTESGSPTKIGEYWASGIPVVTTPRAGDTDEIVEKHRVGVIVREMTPMGYKQAADELCRLLSDPELPKRCRQAAEEYYSLDKGVQAQTELYTALVGKHQPDRLMEQSGD